MPVPMMNILNGGAHAANTVDVQEFMVVPIGADTFSEAIRMGAEVFHTLKKVLSKRKLSTNVGDEGGFAPDLPNDEEAIRVVIEAMRSNLLRNTDFYGNPPGWLPRLNLTTNLKLFETIRGISSELLFFSLTMSDKYEKLDQANALAKRASEAVASEMDQSAARLKKAYGLLDEVRGKVEEIRTKVLAKRDEIATLKAWTEALVIDKDHPVATTLARRPEQSSQAASTAGLSCHRLKSTAPLRCARSAARHMGGALSRCGAG